MRRRKLISVITAVAVAAALLSGCGSQAASEQNVVPDTAVEAEDSSRSGESETQSGAAEQAAAETQTETGPASAAPEETDQTGAEQTASPQAGDRESITTNGGEVIALSALEHQAEDAASTVYFTSEITPEAMTAAYEALGVELSGENIAVKLSTGEPPASNYLDPELIADLVHQVDGTIVENNTAYGGQRASMAMHYQVAEDHGFTGIADFVVLDEEGSVSLPVEGGTLLTENLVDALDGNILFVSVMNHLSIDCDCDGNPAEPDMHDMGILASTDPVALDQACVDMVYASQDDTASLIQRMESRNAVHVLEHGEEIGLGSRTYRMVSIDG